MKYFLITACLLISLRTSAQETKGKFIADVLTGCMIWDENYAPGDSISWEGNCNNKLAEGTGTLKWYAQGKEISRYEGYMVEGLPSGKGKYTYPGGAVSEGNFMNGAFLNLGSSYLEQLKKNKVSISDEGNLFINDANSQSLFYYALMPKDKIKAILVILPSTSETTEEVFSNHAKLVEKACDQNILTIIPSINNRIKLDEAALQFLNDCFSDVLEQYEVPKEKFIIGGLSSGGILAKRYSELSKENLVKTHIFPKAVFAADTPLELTSLYSGDFISWVLKQIE
jgi:hypothetical protein